jgi:hypothetical protein
MTALTILLAVVRAAVLSRYLLLETPLLKKLNLQVLQRERMSKFSMPNHTVNWTASTLRVPAASYFKR